jgi:sugar lactone lactonase YvrE
MHLTLLTDDVVFAESPCWHRDRLWFSDVHDFKLKSLDLAGSLEVVAEVPGRPSGLGVMPDGQLLLATGLERTLNLVDDAGALTVVADLSGLARGLLNDMVVSDRGFAYVGDTGFRPADGEAYRPGGVLLVVPGEDPEVVAEDIEFPNGCAISPDGRTLYLAETFGKRISRFAIDDEGRLGRRTLHAELPESPDGLCLDTDGCMWVAMTHLKEFWRLAPDGTVNQRMASPYALAVTCVFGGADRKSLFLCSADTTIERLSRGDSHGRIDVVTLPTGGAGLP